MLKICPIPNCCASSLEREFRPDPREKSLFEDKSEFVAKATRICNACWQKARKGKDPSSTMHKRKITKWLENTQRSTATSSTDQMSEEEALDYLAELVNYVPQRRRRGKEHTE